MVLDSVSRRLIALALEEDLGPGDVTSALLPESQEGAATVLARTALVVSGLEAFSEVFRQVDPHSRVEWRVREGEEVPPNTTLGEVRGRARALLISERTALNLLQRLCGIATSARRAREAVQGTRARVVDTRKTTPGMRTLEKAAVRAGGAVNHRGNLSEWVMFKDNHLEVLGIAEAVAAAKATWPGKLVHVEAVDLGQVQQALDAGADAILLDNMSPEEAKAAVALVHEWAAGGRRPLLECSGGITVDTAAAYSATGVDLLSTSEITQSAPALDIGLDLR